MALHEKIRRVYSMDPSIYGSAFNQRKTPDALGRRDATPVEILQAMEGRFNLPEEQTVFRRYKRRR